jgi:hypothetical protein
MKIITAVDYLLDKTFFYLLPDFVQLRTEVYAEGEAMDTIGVAPQATLPLWDGTCFSKIVGSISRIICRDLVFPFDV